MHELLPLIEQLKTSGIADGEVFTWDNKPYLTFNGLLRIARTVVLNFVERQPYLEQEEYDWVSELPGRVTLRVAGQYWIWRHEDFSPNRSAEWLSGFLPVLLEAYTTEEAAMQEVVMPDLRPLLAKFESLLGSVSVTQRVQMLTIHLLSNGVVVPEDRSPNYEAIYRENEHLFEECRIESMVFKILTGSEWPWSAEECARAYEAYAGRKFDKQGLVLPWSLEVAVISYVADKYRDAGHEDEVTRWCRRALLEAAGEADWQDHIRAVQQEGRDLNLNVFVR